MDGVFSVRGIVLQARDFKERDAMTCVLTPDKGLINVCVKGAGKPGSRLGFAGIPYIVADFVINISHGYYYLKDATLIESNAEIMQHLESVLTASHMALCLKDVTLQSDNCREAYELACYAYYALSLHPENYLNIYAAFNWRILGIVGQAPEFPEIPDGEERSINLNDGSYTNQTDGVAKLRGQEIKALNFFLKCDIKQLFTTKLSDTALHNLKHFTRQYLSVQFDRDYDTLDVLDGV